MKILFRILLWLVFVAGTDLAAQSKKDSLLKELKTASADTNRVNSLNALTRIYWQTSVFDSALILAEEAKKLSEKLHFKKGASGALNNIGITYWRQGNYPEALRYYFSALKIAEELGDTRKMGAIHGNIGNIYINQAQLHDALKHEQLAVKYATAAGDNKVLSNALNSLANIYYRKAEMSPLGPVRDSFANICEEQYRTVMDLNEKTGNLRNLSYNFNNLGQVLSMRGTDFLRMDRKSEAIETYKRAEQMFRKSRILEMTVGDVDGLAGCYMNLGLILTKLYDYKNAEKYIDSALALSRQSGNLDNVKDAYYTRQLLDSASGNFRSAYEYFKKFFDVRDSLLNVENARKSVEEKMNYEFGKKEAATKAEQEKKDVLAAEEKRRKNLFLLFVAALALAVAIIAAVIFRSLRVTRKQKDIIEVQKDMVERSKEIIEEKNKDITDSINYAKRIQQAKLPAKSDIIKAFPEAFVLFKPKDIVSGDFYYFQQFGKTVIIAAADCTGHGVPGAFMSLISSEKLDEALSHTKNPSDILAHVNHGIRASLKQSETGDSTRDGMDIALCRVELSERIVKFAGANRPLWVIRKGKMEVEEFKATKKAIGGYTDDSQVYNSETVRLQPGDAFYIFSDGYADTFGGRSSKKLTTKKFKELLISVSAKPMADQEISLDSFIEEWKGGTEQVDDILVIGVRL